MMTTPSYPSLESRLSADDERLGMAWWNAMNREDRHDALARAEARFGCQASPAAAWIAWKYATGQIDSPSGRGLRPAPRPTPHTSPHAPSPAPAGSGEPSREPTGGAGGFAAFVAPSRLAPPCL